MFFTKFIAVSFAFAPVIMGFSVYQDIEARGLSKRTPSAQGATEAEIIAGCPCPGLKALMLAKKMAPTDWSNPKVDLKTAEKIFKDNFNLNPDFVKFTVGAASKLSLKPDPLFKAGEFFSFWHATKPDPGQIVHPVCISRKDPTGEKYDPRPFDATTFKAYTANLKGAKDVTPKIQALARKAAVDLHKQDIKLLEWFNVWAESALLLTVLSVDGKGRTVPVSKIEAFFSKGTLSSVPTSAIGMPQLGLLTIELIHEAYKDDFKGFVALISRFTKEGVQAKFQGLHDGDIHAVMTGIHDKFSKELTSLEAGLAVSVTKFFGMFRQS
ncbi:hypothetical protein C8J56DRAFT_1112387 [Mycena floridula]|nr:hypothetical protein C8J56DRAFT_1112387 [Mycena floridula]